MANDHQATELIRWAISIAVPAAAGLIGVVAGALLTNRRKKNQRRLTFAEMQLREFYSPMLGYRNEIRMRSELRVRTWEAAASAWEELCEQKRRIGVEALEELSRSRPDFMKHIEYDNKQFREEQLPAYRQMAKLFRERLWPADQDTQGHYQYLVEFVELWDRWLAESIPAEVIERLGHSGDKLEPFFGHLQQKYNALRGRIEKGEV